MKIERVFAAYVVVTIILFLWKSDNSAERAPPPGNYHRGNPEAISSRREEEIRNEARVEALQEFVEEQRKRDDQRERDDLKRSQDSASSPGVASQGETVLPAHGARDVAQCRSTHEQKFGISLFSIHTVNPYEDFVPSQYGVAGKDLKGWGLDPTLEKVVDSVRPQFMVEVGSWKGLSATNFAKKMRSYGQCALLVCVDTWLGTTHAWHNADMARPTDGNDLHLRNGYPSVFYQFLTNVLYEKADDIIAPLPLPGTMGAIYLQNAKNIDLVYIDGCHDQLCVEQDIESWFPLVKDGGVLFGDDFDRAGVKAAVHSFCDRTPACTLDDALSTKRTWVMQKN